MHSDDYHPRANNLQSYFEGMSELELQEFLAKSCYGDFELTQAIRPSPKLSVVPREGYRLDHFEDGQMRIPVLMASVTKKKLFKLFMDLLDPLGDEVSLVLGTSHNGNNLTELQRNGIDLCVLKSNLYDFEDSLVNDGTTSISVFNPGIPAEVQFDEHKLLIVYANRLKDFREILDSYRIRLRKEMKFITEAEHCHSSTEEYAKAFDRLVLQLNMDDWGNE